MTSFLIDSKNNSKYIEYIINELKSTITYQTKASL